VVTFCGCEREKYAIKIIDTPGVFVPPYFSSLLTVVENIQVTSIYDKTREVGRTLPVLNSAILVLCGIRMFVIQVSCSVMVYASVP